MGNGRCSLSSPWKQHQRESAHVLVQNHVCDLRMFFFPISACGWSSIFKLKSYFYIFRFSFILKLCRLEQFNDILLQENVVVQHRDTPLFDLSSLQFVSENKSKVLEELQVLFSLIELCIHFLLVSEQRTLQLSLPSKHFSLAALRACFYIVSFIFSIKKVALLPTTLSLYFSRFGQKLYIQRVGKKKTFIEIRTVI